MGKVRIENRGRRDFMAGASALSAASWLGVKPANAAEPAPEVRKIRLVHAPTICLAPQYFAEELLKLEGFTEVEYVETEKLTAAELVAGGGADISGWDILTMIPLLDQNKPLVLLSGLHAGCWELFGTDQVNSVRDLKGKTVAIWAFGAGDHVLLSSMLAYVGMDPKRDIKWVTGGTYAETKKLFIDGKVDARMAFPPEGADIREAKVGHVVVSTALDRPWSQYFCCGVATNRDFLTRNPVATKRALRAILKGAEICAQDPERAARMLAEKGYEKRIHVGLETLRQLPYRRWRDASAEDTIRFHGLRLREVGMIKASPQTLIERGTDWRLLNELKKELKA